VNSEAFVTEQAFVKIGSIIFGQKLRQLHGAREDFPCHLPIRHLEMIGLCRENVPRLSVGCGTGRPLDELFCVVCQFILERVGLWLPFESRTPSFGEAVGALTEQRSAR
jgi:hypothetical protein